VIPFGLLDARLTRRRSCTFSTPPNRRVVVTENIVDYAPPDAREHAGLLLINARRWARTPSGLPRLAQALHAWLDARSAPHEQTREVAGLVEWL
jgi:hypothetical protein